MSKTKIDLAPQVGCFPNNHSDIIDLDVMPFLDHTKTVDKSAKDTRQTFDGYEFHTDWNGSTNYMLTNNGNPFAGYGGDSLRFYTTEKIGKDRRLFYQWWDRSNSNLWLPNVIGYTGMWRHNDRQYHPRLQMVVFHYMDSNGNRTHDYKVDQNLKAYNSSSHYWRYDESGQHDSGVDWYIGYQLSESRRRTICEGDHRLMGMSWSILYRTAAASHSMSGYFHNFKPIIGTGSAGAISANASSCKSGKRMVLPAYGNTYPKSGSKIKLM